MKDINNGTDTEIRKFFIMMNIYKEKEVDNRTPNREKWAMNKENTQRVLMRKLRERKKK